MKKTLTAVLAVLLLTALCVPALAMGGDVTVKDVKAYSDAAMKDLVGTIPAYTALLVRSYDSYADVTLNGQVYYIDSSALMGRDPDAKFTATLKRGTKVYQRATTDANSVRLAKASTVKVCKIKGGWALVQSTGKLGAYAFVKLGKLSNIQAIV